MRSHKTATVCISFWRNHRLPASAKPWEVRRQSPCLMPGPDAPPLPFWIPGSRNDGGGSGSATPSPQPSPATGRGSKRPRPIRSCRFPPEETFRVTETPNSVIPTVGRNLRVLCCGHEADPATRPIFDNEALDSSLRFRCVRNDMRQGHDKASYAEMPVWPISKVRRRSGRPLGRPCRGRRPRARCDCSLAAG